MTKKEIKAIIFDVGGVIYIGEQRANSYMPELLKINKEVWKKATGETWEKLVINNINEDAGLIEMAKNLRINKSKLRKLWNKAFKVRFILNKDLLKIIKKLRKNYKTAILSDQWSIPYKIQLTKKVKSNFDVMIFSHQVGFRKPSPDIYHIALKRLNLKPNECVFIDDLEENLVPAKKIGIRTILFKNNNQLIKDLKKLGIIFGQFSDRKKTIRLI
jgi:putative hydrolase of the HAD superfamily